MKCPQRKLLATDDDMLHPQAEKRHCMAMLKKSIDESETRNEKRLERERQQNMREHAIDYRPLGSSSHTEYAHLTFLPFFAVRLLEHEIRI